MTYGDMESGRLGNGNAIPFCARPSLKRLLSQIPYYEAAAGIRDVFAMQQRPQILACHKQSYKFPWKNHGKQRRSTMSKMSKDSSLRMFAMSKVLPLERLEPGHRQLDLGRGALSKIWELDSLKRLEALIDMRWYEWCFYRWLIFLHVFQCSSLLLQLHSTSSDSAHPGRSGTKSCTAKKTLCFALSKDFLGMRMDGGW